MCYKSKAIFVAGYCATGKSTFSRKLAENLGIPCFNKDTIKEVIGEPIGSKDREANLKLSAASFELMLYTAERMLKAGNIFTLESNFKPHEVIKLKKLIESYKCESLAYVFTGDLNILYKRYIERDETEARHWVHRFAVKSYNDFVAGNVELGSFDVGDKINYIDATNYENIDYNELIKIAKRFKDA